MKIAVIENHYIRDVAVFRDLETAQAFLNRGMFPGAAEVVGCPYGYGIGDLYENGVFTKADGTTPALEPELPPAQPVPSTEDDLLAMAVDHEYRLTLLELGVI